MKMLFLISIVLINLVAFGQQKDPGAIETGKNAIVQRCQTGYFYPLGIVLR